MEYNISIAKSEEIVLNFLKQNVFNEDAEIIRYFSDNGKPLVYVKDTTSYHGERVVRLTKIAKYEVLLKRLLILRGKDVARVDLFTDPYSTYYTVTLAETYCRKRRRGK